MRKVLWMLAGFVMTAGAVCAEDNLSGYRLEGVMLDQENPSASVAIINGALLRPGEAVGDYLLVRVEKEAAVVAPKQGGAEVRLSVSAKSVEAAAASAPEPAPAGWGERLKAWWDTTFSPPPAHTAGAPDAVNLWERVAMTDLYKIFLARNGFQEMKQKPAASLQELVEAGLLPERYREGVYGQYRFSLSAEGIQADPRDSHSGLRHFLLDNDSRLRIENDKPAAPDSSLYEGKTPL